MSTCTRPHVLVTGASTGIGRATALHLAAHGHHVYAGVRKSADGTALEQAAADGTVTPLLLDITDSAHIAAATTTIAKHTGPVGLAGLVNNAGVGEFGPLELIDIDAFRRQLDINVTAQLAVTQALLPLLRQAQGRIVMIGSIGRRFTPPFVGALAASKSALASMSEALRQELAPWNIRVVVIDPANIRSEAVDKLDRDAERSLSQTTSAGHALYQDAFQRMVAAFGAQHDKGSPSEAAARTVAHALTTPRPRVRYLTGKHAHQMAFMAAVLPIPILDALRRKRTNQPAPGARVPTTEPTPAGR